jgi:hemerythrin-like metal-binding protein
MALLEWRDDFRTGIEGVDYEHENLIGQINAVYALIGDRADRERVIDSLGEIYGSISAHFALEEQMMKRNDYAGYLEHKADHDRLLDEIRDITDQFEASTELNEAAFKRRLANWFQLHFKTQDARLHRMAGMRAHEPVNPSTLKSLIRNAKNRLLHRPRH